MSVNVVARECSHAAITNGLRMVRVRLENHAIWLDNELKRCLMADNNGCSTIKQLPDAMDVVSGKVYIN